VGCLRGRRQDETNERKDQSGGRFSRSGAAGGTGGSLAAAPMLRLSSSTIGPYSSRPARTAPRRRWKPGMRATARYRSGFVLGRVGRATIGAARACSTRLGTCLPIQVALQTASLAKGAYTGTITVGDPNPSTPADHHGDRGDRRQRARPTGVVRSARRLGYGQVHHESVRQHAGLDAKWAALAGSGRQWRGSSISA